MQERGRQIIQQQHDALHTAPPFRDHTACFTPRPQLFNSRISSRGALSYRKSARCSYSVASTNAPHQTPSLSQHSRRPLTAQWPTPLLQLALPTYVYILLQLTVACTDRLHSCLTSGMFPPNRQSPCEPNLRQAQDRCEARCELHHHGTQHRHARRS